MASKSKILIIGATGYIGKYLVEASAKNGHPTFAMFRESAASDPRKAAILEDFKNLGVTFVYADLSDHDKLVAAIKQVDVVISAVAGELAADQVNIISAIKEAGGVKRFLPSEFGTDVDRGHGVGPVATYFKMKADIRRAIEAEGIPYTYVASHGFASFFLKNLGDYTSKTPPRDKITITGDGNVKAVFVTEEDIATYTIRGVDDPRTLNKILYLRPPANTLSYNEMVSLWEKKIGKTLDKIYITEEQLLKKIQEASMPENLMLALLYSMFIKGDNTYFEIENSFGVEATQLYPDIKYTTTDDYLNQFV